MTKEEATTELISILRVEQNRIHKDFVLIEALRMAVEALEEQRTGHWMSHKHTDTVLCSECDKCYGDEYNYCPSCGAKMESEEG